MAITVNECKATKLKSYVKNVYSLIVAEEVVIYNALANKAFDDNKLPSDNHISFVKE